MKSGREIKATVKKELSGGACGQAHEMTMNVGQNMIFFGTNGGLQRWLMFKNNVGNRCAAQKRVMEIMESVGGWFDFLTCHATRRRC